MDLGSVTPSGRIAGRSGRSARFRTGQAWRVRGGLVLLIAVELLAGLALSRQATLTVGGLIVCAVAGYSFLRPVRALLVFVAVWGPIHGALLAQSARGGAATRAVGLAVLLGLGIALLDRRLTGSPPSTPGPVRLLVLFTAVYAMAVTWAPDPSAGVSDLVKIGGGVLLALASFAVIDSPQRLLSLCRAATLGGAVIALIVSVQFILLQTNKRLAESIFGSTFYSQSFNSLPGSVPQRVGDTFGGASDVGGFLLVCSGFALLLYTLMRDTSRERTTLLLLGLISFGIMATLTRTAVGGFVIALAIWTLYWPLRAIAPVAARTRLILASVLLTSLLVLVAGNTLAARLSDLNPSSSGAQFATGRGAVWSSELARLRTAGLREITGGQGAHTSETLVYSSATGHTRAFAPHDVFLWLVIETGLIGLVLYTSAFSWLTLRLLKVARRGDFSTTRKIGTVGLAMTVAYMVNLLFHNAQTSVTTSWYFMIFAGAVLRGTVAPAGAGRAVW